MEMIKETLPPNKIEKETKVKPKKAVGRPRIHTEEENKHIKREIARKHYLNNIEKTLQKKNFGMKLIEKQSTQEQDIVEIRRS